MKRRSFLAAVVPLIAVVAPATGQSPLGTAATGDPARPIGGRLRPNAGTPAGAAEAPAAPAAAHAAGTEAKKAKGPTEITSREAMLDNRINLATFSGEVEVKDPEYYLTCDKLTVHLRKQKGKGGDAKPATGTPKPIGAADDEPAPKAAAPAEKGGGDGGIEKAIAEGNVTITQDKVDPNGKKQHYYGKARRAVFDQDKKTCVLYGWPRISQTVEEKDSKEGREIIATQENTVITLDQAGIINVAGPNRVILNGLNSFEPNSGGSR
jgi:lipopolysaccharide export system protein LptA